jgi:hypothetical protein
MKYLVLLTLPLLTLTSCKTTENYNQYLSTFSGQNVTQVVNVMGAPTSNYEMPNGDKILTYNKVKTGSMVSQYGQILGSGECKTDLVFDANNILKRWVFEGNKCKM